MEPLKYFQFKLAELFESFKARGGTQKTLAEAAGATQSQVSTWLKGGYAPGYESLIGLAKAFDVPVTVFYPPEVTMQPSLPPTPAHAALLSLIGRLTEDEADHLGEMARALIADREADGASPSNGLELQKKARKR